MLNLTPHAIVVVVGYQEYVFPPSGVVARVSTVEKWLVFVRCRVRKL